MADRSDAPGERPDLNKNIEKIAAYTSEHPELRSAHHFLYDLRSPPRGKPRYVVMGINPGETSRDWRISPKPTEETSRYDFHHRSVPAGSALRWATLAKYFLAGADHVLTELFFWSSANMRQFSDRFGLLAKSPHLEFCGAMNKELIDVYDPEAVILPGLGMMRLAARLYGLSHVATVKEGAIRVVETYTDGHRPWHFTKHWTGSFGFSNAQRIAVRHTILSGVNNLTTREFAEEPVAPAMPSVITRPNAGIRKRLATAASLSLVFDKLQNCESWVKREFDRLEDLVKEHARAATEEKSGPGAKYWGDDGWIVRIHPKQNHIAIGFPNDMRSIVAATGLLRAQREAAWINYDRSVRPNMIKELIDISCNRLI